MTSIFSTSQGIPVSQLKKFDTSSLSVHKLSQEDADRIQQAIKGQHKILANPEQADNHPSNTYATVKVNGKIVATLYNSGASATSNAAYSKVKNLPSMGEEEQLTGPMLAQKRAEEIAKALGGTVEKAPTAQNQAQWQSRPPIEWTYDYGAMDAALNSATAKTRFETQAIAQSEFNQPALSQEAEMARAAKEEFLKFMSQTTEEKYLDLILKEMDITKEELEAMSPEEREAIMKKVQERIKDDIEKEAGIPFSSSADTVNAG